MDDYVDAIIRVKVPKWQIGEEVSVHFPDTMMKRGKCEIAPHGEWKYVQYDGNANIGNWHCSECGRVVFDYIRHLYKSYSKKPYYNFCPNCGADMRGAE